MYAIMTSATRDRRHNRFSKLLWRSGRKFAEVAGKIAESSVRYANEDEYLRDNTGTVIPIYQIKVVVVDDEADPAPANWSAGVAKLLAGTAYTLESVNTVTVEANPHATPTCAGYANRRRAEATICMYHKDDVRQAFINRRHAA